MRGILIGFVLVFTGCTGGKQYSSLDGGDIDGTLDDVDAGDGGVQTGDAQAVPAEFALVYGNTYDDSLTALRPTANGLILAGSLPGGGMIGNVTLPAKSFFLAGLDRSGAPLWAQGYGPALLADAVVDPSNDIVVTGFFAGTTSFGGPSLTAAGNYDLFVAKFSGIDGSHKWSVRYGGTSEERSYAACVDPSGDVYVGGFYTAASNVGGANISSSGPYDMFVAKYGGANGSYIWSVAKGGTMADYATSMDCDASKVVASGPYAGTTNLGGSDIGPRGGSNEFFVAAYNSSNGNHLWSVGHGGTGNDNSTAIDLEGGAVYVVGHYSETVSLGGPTRTNKGLTDMFVAKYDSGTGSYVWDKTFGDTKSDYAYAVKAIGASVVVTGEFPTKINFGSGDLNSAGENDLFVATLSQTNGSYVDAWRLGGTNSEVGHALADLDGTPIVGGRFAGVVYFGSTEATAKGGWDSFVFKRKPQ